MTHGVIMLRMRDLPSHKLAPLLAEVLPVCRCSRT